MNLFKAIGTVTKVITDAIVATAGVVTKLISSCDDIANMANITTSSMANDMKLENDANTELLKQKLADTKATD